MAGALVAPAILYKLTPSRATGRATGTRSGRRWASHVTVLIPAPAQRRQVLGHFAPLRWTAKEKQAAILHEVVVVAEYLNRDVNQIVGTLLHEAAHAQCHERGIHDCSATSQYHNKKFKAAAEELGLQVEKMGSYGFARTRLTDEPRARYAAVTSELEAALLHRRSWFGVRTPTSTTSGKGAATTTTSKEDKPRNRNLKATCACGFIIRASRKTLAATTITCTKCGMEFETGH